MRTMLETGFAWNDLPFRIVCWPVEPGSPFRFSNLVFERPLFLCDERCFFGESFDVTCHRKLLAAQNAHGWKLRELGLSASASLYGNGFMLGRAQARFDRRGRIRLSGPQLLRRHCAAEPGNVFARTKPPPHSYCQSRNAYPGQHRRPPNSRWSSRRQPCQHPSFQPHAWLYIAIVL